MMVQAQNKRPRDRGIEFGILKPGKWNAITDVEGVLVGHYTLHKADSIRTGVTAIKPFDGNVFAQKVPAAIWVANGFGKLAGSTQVNELGNLETPVVLTNTLSVAAGMEGLIEYTLRQAENREARSVNAVVGETNDGYLNDIRGRHVTPAMVLEALENARTGPVEEGSVGAGTGTVCFGFKGGIGTSSRKLPANLGGYTVGVLVQSNFGGVLQVNGAPVGKELGQYAFKKALTQDADGSCMIVVATDAPLSSRNLERLAKRAFLGMGKTGGIASNGSGDYVIAFSTNPSVRMPHEPSKSVLLQPGLMNEEMSPLFLAAIEATEEAIINSLFAATEITGINGNKVSPLPLEKTLGILKKYNAIK